MQRRLVVKEIFQKLGVHIGVDGGAGVDDGGERVVALEDDQRAGLGPGEGVHRLDGLDDGGVGGAGLNAAAGEEAGDLAAAELLQHLAQLRLEDDHQRQDSHLHDGLQDIVDHIQVHHIGKLQDHDHRDQPVKQLLSVGVPQKPHQAVQQKGHDQDVDDIPCGGQLGVIDDGFQKLHKPHSL